MPPHQRGCVLQSVNCPAGYSRDFWEKDHDRPIPEIIFKICAKTRNIHIWLFCNYLIIYRYAGGVVPGGALSGEKPWLQGGAWHQSRGGIPEPTTKGRMFKTHDFSAYLLCSQQESSFVTFLQWVCLLDSWRCHVI